MELRMLSGLHRGAALRLEPGSLTVGAAAECEVMLADPGIATRHASIRREGPLSLLIPGDGPIYDQAGRRLDQETEIAAGTLFRLGGVWIGFFGDDDPWLDAIPEPKLPAPPVAGPVEQKRDAAAEAEAARSAKLSVQKFLTDLGARISSAWGPRLSWLVGIVSGLAIATALAIAVAVGGQKELSAKVGPPRSQRVPAQADQDQAAGKPARRGAAESAEEVPAPRARPRDTAKDKAADKPPRRGAVVDIAQEGGPPAAEQPRLSRSELTQLFTRHLADRDLKDKVDLAFAAEHWEVKASLDEEDKTRLERAVRSFESKYQPGVPIELRVVAAQDMLPFRVVQVSSGRGANIVTERGQRVFVGDTIEGYQLVAVESNKLVFAGKRRIEVAW